MTAEPVLAETPRTHHRFHFLDALRGIAAIMVVFYHAPRFGFMKSVMGGYLAVDFFFCLSGFVIAFSYERRLQETMSWRQFAAARVMRLYPMFLLGSVLGISLFFALDHHHVHYAVDRLWLAVGLQILMIPNYARASLTGGIFPFDYPAWSLFYELLANGLYAFLVRKRVSNRWWLGILLVTCLGSVVRLALTDTFNLGVGATWEQAQMAFYRVGLSFLLGVIVLRLYRRVPHPAWSKSFSGACGFVVVLLLISSLQFVHSTAVELSEVALLFPVLVFAGAFVQVSKFWVPLCVFLGDASYPVYLLHIPLLKLFTAPFLRHMSTTYRGFAVGLLILGIVSLFFLSHLVVRYYDEPARRWLRKMYNDRTHALLQR